MDQEADNPFRAGVNERLQRFRANGGNGAAVAAAIRALDPPGNGNIVNGDEEGEDEIEDESPSPLLEVLENGAYEGGSVVAADPNGTKREKSTSCDLILYIECEESLDMAPDHPIMKPGVRVAIGLAKNTRLGLVFARFVQFCNSAAIEQPQIPIQSLEFTLCQVLDGTETAEASALMKNDTIKVRRIRAKEREGEMERKRIQRATDKDYFRQLKHLIPDSRRTRGADVILDCKGTLSDGHGRNQQVLSTTVRAHSMILRKRCKWLSEMIDTAWKLREQARLEEKQSRERAAIEDLTQPRPTPSDQNLGPIIGMLVNQDSDVAATRIEADTARPAQPVDDDGIVVNFPPAAQARADSGATAIEIVYEDEDEDPSEQDLNSSMSDGESMRPGSPVPFAQHLANSSSEFLWITIKNHSPEAVKMLLEYCYTNRVAPLGYAAFVSACRTKPQKHNGPVAPYLHQQSSSRAWPNNGSPTISFSVALDAIALAEQASMRRFSLMCEVAAANLVTSHCIVEALAMCTHQENLTGNSLPRLRKAVMDILLRNGHRGIDEVERSTPLSKVLKEQPEQLLPTLLKGTVEAVTPEDVTSMIGLFKKRTYAHLGERDQRDIMERDIERKRRRLGGVVEEGMPMKVQDLIYDLKSGWGNHPSWSKSKSKRGFSADSLGQAEDKSASILRRKSRRRRAGR